MPIMPPKRGLAVKTKKQNLVPKGEYQTRPTEKEWQYMNGYTMFVGTNLVELIFSRNTDVPAVNDDERTGGDSPMVEPTHFRLQDMYAPLANLP